VGYFPFFFGGVFSPFFGAGLLTIKLNIFNIDKAMENVENI